MSSEPGGAHPLHSTHDVLSRISDGCIILDRDLRIIYANSPAGEVFGLPAEALLGLSLRSDVPGPVAVALREPAARAIASGVGRRLLVRPTAGRWLEAGLHPSRDGLFAILGDATDTVRARTAAVTPDALKTGVAALSDLSWGTHVCQFYESRQDQLDVLVPYFRAGLANHEFCLWVLDAPLTVADARGALQRGLPDADRHLAAGDIEIVEHGAWSPSDKPFSGRRIIDGWDAKLADALARGYAAMRVGGNPRGTWLNGEERGDFFQFEQSLTEWVAGKRVLVLCTYPLAGSTSADVFDTARAHQYAVVRREGEWEVIEVLALAEARAAVQHRNEELERRVAERTQQLATANEELRRQIEERVRAEAAQRESDEVFRVMADDPGTIIGLYDTAGRRVYANPATRQILGDLPEDPFLRVHPEDLDAARVAWARLLAGGRTSFIFRYRRADGAWLWMEAWSSQVEYRGAPHVMSIIRDVTERVHAQEQLRQAQKMEAIGQLAGGVAHDFNNLLTVIKGYTDFIRASSTAADEHRRDADEIAHAADRAALLTQQLLAFSRKQVLRPEVLEINRVVDEASRMLGRLLGEDVALDLQLAPDAGAVLADAGQLQQVLLNLAVNARDAMPLGGRLTIATGNLVVEREAPAQPTPVTPGRYVRLVVGDTGTGMSPEVLQHAFEPFYTTKEPGKGTGLGLSTVYGIVTQSHGRLRVDSVPGTGTTFEILLPQADEPAATPTAVTTKPGARGSETVLLVEDDAMVRRLAEATLERAGYRVLSAPSGGDALRLAAGRVGAIDLVVTDVVMPGMPGPELAQRLEASHPGLRVLYMSGYADDTMARHGISEEQVSFLAKPFTPDELGRRVREVLDAG